MAIYNTPITASNTLLRSGTGNRAITTIIVCNTTGGDLPLTIHAVENNAGSAGTISESTIIVSSLNVPAGDTVSFDQEKMVLTTGDDVWAVSTGTGLSATVSTLAV
jgi:hypothetical protein